MKGGALKAIFALAIFLQVLWFGLPIPTPDPQTGINELFDPVTEVVSGYLIYTLRAFVAVIIAALLLHRF